MSILFASLAVTYAAILVLLAVRFVNRREKWVRRSLVALIIVTPLLYLASFGPACWWLSITLRPPTRPPGVKDAYSEYRLPSKVYWPLGWTANKLGSTCFQALHNYGRLRLPDSVGLAMPTGPNEFVTFHRPTQ